MAEAAIWMAAAAVLTLFITSMGTLLIWRQVKLTRQAVEDTSDATEAMREANVIARTIGRVQTRAYLSIQGLVGETFDNGLVFTATVKNCGQSPALSAQIMRSEEHTSELQSLMRISYAVFCLKKNK